MIKKILLLILFFLPTSVSAVVVASNFNVNLEVNNCNNNSICESENDENFLSCQNDCPATCDNDDVCESINGEDESNCSADCGEEAPISNPSTGGGGGGAVIAPLVTSTRPIVFNVVDLSALAEDAVVTLTWKVIDKQSYGGVLIRRSNFFSPSSITEGGVLYNGMGDDLGEGRFMLKDSNLINGKWYFYTIFLFNKLGEFSSGASVSALPQTKEMKKDSEILVIPPKQLTPELSLPKKENIKNFDTVFPKDINFVQNNKLLDQKDRYDNFVILKTDATTTIIIEKDKTPLNTKSIVATIDDGESFKTLLFKRENNGNFSLFIPGGSLPVNSKLNFTFIDKSNEVLDRLVLNVSAIESTITVDSKKEAKSAVTESKLRIKTQLMNSVRAVGSFFVNLFIEVIKFLKGIVSIFGN